MVYKLLLKANTDEVITTKIKDLVSVELVYTRQEEKNKAIETIFI